MGEAIQTKTMEKRKKPKQMGRGREIEVENSYHSVKMPSQFNFRSLNLKHKIILVGFKENMNKQ